VGLPPPDIRLRATDIGLPQPDVGLPPTNIGWRQWQKDKFTNYPRFAQNWVILTKNRVLWPIPHHPFPTSQLRAGGKWFEPRDFRELVFELALGIGQQLVQWWTRRVC
jgi:hypothetical protein